MIRSSLLLAAGLALAGRVHAGQFRLSSADIKPNADIRSPEVTS